MGRGEEIGSGRQASKIESDREVGMKSLDLSDCTPLRFIRGAAAIHRDGDDVIAPRTEIRKDNVGANHAAGKNYCRNRRCATTASCARLAQINCFGHRSGRYRGGWRSNQMGPPVEDTRQGQATNQHRRQSCPSPIRSSFGNFRPGSRRSLLIPKSAKFDQLPGTLGALENVKVFGVG